jgi:Zn-dependent peptidase ImmA (M78 family)
MQEPELKEYIESQKSLHLYKNIQDACIDVFSKLDPKDLDDIKNNLIIMAFHDSVYGQVMHFPPRQAKFAVMQLYIPKDMPDDVLRWVIAHELGHVMQGRNWQKSDGSRLEVDASEFAEKIGYPKTDKISKWLWPDLP